MLLDLAVQNLLSPAVVLFVVGVGAALARSDLSVPEPVARLLSLYLMMSIGFRGGIEIAHQGIDGQLALVLSAGVLLSFGIPFLAAPALGALSALPRVDRAAIAGHYGSISAVTFAAAVGAASQTGLPYEGFMVAVAAAMETPAIVAALMLAGEKGGGRRSELLREVAPNGSVLVLLGALVAGALASPRAAAPVKPLLVDLFPGFLCLFLLEMGLVAGRGLREAKGVLTPGLIGFALLAPLVGATAAAGLGWAVGLSAGGAAILMTLAASASYIAAPAALRLALPNARLAIPLTMSLGITFPFNLLIGIPIYMAAAKAFAR
jgi:hypothetical protein